MRGTVYLGGGGSAADEAALWSEMLRTPRRILYWPFALSGPILATADEWLRRQLGRWRNDVELTTWTGLDGRDATGLRAYDLLFVGGGNTFGLLDQIRRSGFADRIEDFVAAGGNYYGGSAGALLAGASIGLAEDHDPNDVGLTDLTGLALLPGHAVLPHYTHAQRAAGQAWSRAFGPIVLGVPERSGVVAEPDGGLRVVGADPVAVLTATHAQSFPPGATIGTVPRSGDTMPR